jgi:tRNA(His) guanylyltransferase
MSKDNLGDRVKNKYEDAYRIHLPGRMPVVLRLDGCHFHSLTKDFNRPWDDGFISAMTETARYLCANIQGCVLGYTQSDEITLVLVNYKKLESESWFDNNLQKMTSVAASMAAVAFNKELKKHYPDKEGFFDCRAFVAPREEVNNILLWRQNDATRNSVQMLARAHFSHKELHGLGNSELQDKLILEKGINWNDLATHKKRGACVRHVRIDAIKGKSLVDKWQIDLEPPRFSQDREYVNDLLIPQEE